MMRLSCCGGQSRPVATPLGVRFVNDHMSWCRVGRLLSWPSYQDTREVAPTDDRRQVRTR